MRSSVRSQKVNLALFCNGCLIMRVFTPRSVHPREGRESACGCMVLIYFKKKKRERHLACSFSVGNCNKPLFLNPITL